LVLEEIKENTNNAALQAVRLLAMYTTKPENKELVLITLKEWLSDGIAATNPTLQLIAAQIYYLEENFEDAMRCVYQSSTLEG
jgi:coatomer protein complex subunit epsilon